MRVRIVDGCYVQGTPEPKGKVLDLPAQEFLDLVSCGRGEPLDRGDVTRASDAVRQATARLLARSDRSFPR